MMATTYRKATTVHRNGKTFRRKGGRVRSRNKRSVWEWALGINKPEKRKRQPRYVSPAKQRSAWEKQQVKAAQTRMAREQQRLAVAKAKDAAAKRQSSATNQQRVEQSNAEKRAAWEAERDRRLAAVASLQGRHRKH